ncbi:chymotrypsin-2-like [Nomia melanderi]|uniref:chymotrypsin-2-like n=1 Tax=Nomia melanderi TaxID=2448451 RepID=UPI0013046C0C|nr:chymotrypsin-2-like [Nomia melanderi]
MVSLIALVLPAIIAVANCELDPRIVNGKTAYSGQFPYQVSLQTRSTSFHFCGGSILNADYVLTAAHCVESKKVSEIKVVAGTTNLDKPYLTRNASSIYYHAKYNSSDSWINDIALIKVKPAFVKSSLVSWVPMPTYSDKVKEDDKAVVSGFGRLAYNGDRTKILHWANITIASQTYCKNVWSKKIYNAQLCAYDPNEVRGHCKGDSGGPLTVNGKLAGIVSWSKNCADRVYPSVYTRVSMYLAWIKTHAV